ncbi:MAG TPA: hypothetical protein PKA41_02780 [Verrucomicrobiota bacterium]|nr:hypothetical protein [Verrucomicrobiota bacterium]
MAIAKAFCSIAVMLAVESSGANEAQAVPTLLPNGDLRISFVGTPGQNYVAEWSEELIVPVTWTPMRTNKTDVYGQVSFTNSPADSQRFYRVRYDPSAPLPLVYAVENTGSRFPAPPMPTLASGNLPLIQGLPDPFAWASDPLNLGNTRSTNFANWYRRRAEIKAQIENYEIGIKPVVEPTMIFAGVTGTGTNRTLTVRTTNIVNGVVRTLTQTANITLPAASGTFPAMIGMNGNPSSSIIGGRAIARISYNANQVTTYGSQANSHPYYLLYAAPHSPALNSDNTGQYSAWAWGCSRLIDGLHLLNGDLGNGVQINLERIGVTGCSYAGKMALFCGALDERIALTIPQESGGGGAPNWRYSATEPSGTVEWIPNTDYNWFRQDMSAFGTVANVSFLPHDHHSLLAMVAPRALFVTGNPDGAAWLSNPSCYVSCRAAEQVYNTFGIGDRLGWNINGGKAHCAFTTDVISDMGAFVDKFLMGLTNINTVTNRHVPASYSTINHASWYQAWGTSNAWYTLTYEAECATVGTNWNIFSDVQASNGRFVVARTGATSAASAPTNTWDWVTFPFTVATNGTYHVFWRLNSPGPFTGSFWVRINSGPWFLKGGVVTAGWQWVSVTNVALAEGQHTIDVGYGASGPRLDKISISDSPFSPAGLGNPAENLCSP